MPKLKGAIPIPLQGTRLQLLQSINDADTTQTSIELAKKLIPDYL